MLSVAELHWRTQTSFDSRKNKECQEDEEFGGCGSTPAESTYKVIAGRVRSPAWSHKPLPSLVQIQAPQPFFISKELRVSGVRSGKYKGSEAFNI